MGDLEEYANRLGASTRSRAGSSGAASAFPGASSGLAGAASGLAGGGLAQRFLSGGSDEDFKKEVIERLALLEERLQRLEDQMRTPAGEVGNEEGVTEGGEEPYPEDSR